MSNTLEDITLNRKLILDGFEVYAAIPNEELPECLTEYLIKFARGEYTDMRIIPGDIALEGSEWLLEKPSHIVYVKYNKNHPDYKPDSITIVQPGLIHKKTKEHNSSLPLHMVDL